MQTGIVLPGEREARNPKTPGQLAQRAKMKALQKVSLYFAPAAELGFPGRKAGSTFYNAFVKANIDVFY